MAKQKFTLTSDLVKVEPEPKEVESVLSSSSLKESPSEVKKISMNKEKVITKEVINFKIETNLKKKFQRWCFDEGISMSDVITDLIKKKVG